MTKYIVSAGSSHHQGISYLGEAKRLLNQRHRMTVYGESAIFKNSSKGCSINRLCFNQAFAIEAPMEPLVFYRELKDIECKLGRIRPYKNSPRTIDLDVLISFGLIYNSSTFSIPHKETYTRSFFVFCAIEAIMSAAWPVPYALHKAQHKLCGHYLQQVANF